MEGKDRDSALHSTFWRASMGTEVEQIQFANYVLSAQRKKKKHLHIYQLEILSFSL